MDWVALPWSKLGGCSILVFAIAALAKIALASDPPRHDDQVPSLAWDGTTYAAAWASPRILTTDVYAYRFPPQAAREWTSTRESWRPTHLLTTWATIGSPEIVASGHGYLVLVVQDDHDLLVFPLDRTGKSIGKPRRVAVRVQALCTSPVYMDGSYAVGYISSETGMLNLTRLDDRGESIKHEMYLVFDLERCAMAAANGYVAVASDRGLHYLQPEAMTTAADWSHPVRVVRHGALWAVLQEDEAYDNGRVELYDDVGRWSGGYDLPRSVEPGSVDLASNNHGLFVTWMSWRGHHLLAVPDGPLRRHPVTATDKGTRALGHDDECAMAWTSGRGARVHLRTARNCP
jgi:hypothetical protein